MLLDIVRKIPPRFIATKSGSIAHIYNMHKIGNREIVGYGRGTTNYFDSVDSPMPAVRWKENHSDIAVSIRNYLQRNGKWDIFTDAAAQRNGSMGNVEYARETIAVSSIVSANFFRIYGTDWYMENVYRLCILCNRFGAVFVLVFMGMW